MNKSMPGTLPRVLLFLRVVVETACAVFITANVLGYGALLSGLGEPLRKIQLVPAILGLSAAVVAVWVVLTLVFGRIYCSTVCPMATVFDVGALTRPLHRPFRFSRPLRTLRLAMLAVGIALTALPWVPQQWIEPSGWYALMVSHAMWRHAIVGGAVAAWAAIMLLLWTGRSHGRLLCNTLCPVGTLLGMLSRRSAMHFDINTDTCTNCRRCVDACKAQCIDPEAHVVDMSRCVVCFNCTATCPEGSITYTTRRHTLSDAMMQPLSQFAKPKQITPNICDNTSTCSPTSSKTE